MLFTHGKAAFAWRVPSADTMGAWYFPNQCPCEDGCGQLVALLGRRRLLIMQKRLIDELLINLRHLSVFAVTRHVVIYLAMRNSRYVSVCLLHFH